ncbi:MAG: Hpt domain-containing protein [Betaproteobacteria bacterium]|nr:Hpt domain-containing protein [Betaproteobacteria bacterium]
MRQALNTIEATQETPAHRAFWWVSVAFLEALADGAVASEMEARQLCGRIDLQIRRLLEGSRNVAERLMRDALYYVAKAPAENGDVARAVRSGFGLDSLVPAAEMSSAAAPQEAHLRKLRESIIAAEEAWNKFCAGSAGMLAPFAESSRQAATLTAEVGHTDLKRLGQGLAAIANWLAEDPKRHGEGVAMEVATAILLLQNAQENFRRLGTDFAQQVDLMVARLHACIAGRPADTDEAIPLLDEMTRRAQEKLLIAQVAREIQSNLAQIEQALDTFFRAPDSGAGLAALDNPLNQVYGALTILGHDGALETLSRCRAQIEHFAAPDYQANQSDFEAVAEELSMLGFFIDSLQHGAADYGQFIRKLLGESAAAQEESESAADDDTAPAPSVEQQLEQQRKDAQALMVALRDAPADAQLRDELKQNLQAIQKDADLVADHQLGETAKAALSALETGTFDPVATNLRPTAAEAPAPSAETLQLAQSSHEEIDAELLDIFLEEAKEVLLTMAGQYEALESNPHDGEALTTLRRSSHTLKGSGRMVGLKDLGEAAWAIEQTLNLWLRQELPVTPDLLSLLQQSCEVFGAWVGHLENPSVPAPDPRAMVALAERLRDSGDTAAAPTPSPSPASAQVIQLPTASAPIPAPSEIVDIPDIEPLEPIEANFNDIVPELGTASNLAMEFSLDAVDTAAVEGSDAYDPAATQVNPNLPPSPAASVPGFEDLGAFVGADTLVSPFFAREHEEFAPPPEEPLVAPQPALPLAPEPPPARQEAPPEPEPPPRAEAPAPAPSFEDMGSFVGAETLVAPFFGRESEEFAPPPETPIFAPPPFAAPSEGPAAPAEAPVLATPDARPEPPAPAPTPPADPFDDLGAFVGADTQVAPFFAAESPEEVRPGAHIFPDTLETAEEDTGLTATLVEPVMADQDEAPPTGEPEAGRLPDTVVEPAAFGLGHAEVEVAFAAEPEIPPAACATASSGGPFDAESTWFASPPGDEVAPAAEAEGGHLAETVVDPGAFSFDESSFAVSFEPEPAPEPEPPPEPVPALSAAAPAEPEPLTVCPSPAGDDAPPAPEAAPEAPPPTLFDIFREEARGHLDTLHASLADLAAHPSAPTTFEMTRAAHTLGGIAATVGLHPIHHLAVALEHALLRRDTSARPDSIAGLETVRQAILGLEDMFGTLGDERGPAPLPTVVQALDEIFPPPGPAPEPPAAEEAAEPLAEIPPEAVALPSESVEEAAAPAPELEMPRLKDELDDQLLPIFLEEAQELVRGFNEQIAAWRGQPGDGAAPRALARHLHTFKGSARMAGAMNLGELTHRLETRVEEILRGGSGSPAQIDEVEGGCDTLVLFLDRLQGGELPVLFPEAAPVAAVEQAAPAAPAAEVAQRVAATTVAVKDAPHPEGEHEAADRRATLRVRAELVDRLVNEAGELSIARARIEGEMRGLKSSLLDLTENVIRLRRQLRDIEIQAETQIQARVAQAHDGQAEFDPLELDRFTRFQELTRFMAESVNDVATVQQNLLKNLDDANAALLAQARLNRGLQQELMGVRMLPFASQAERLYRIVRQTSKELGKRANLDIRGGQVEIDRSVLDKMLAPLEHMLRNAVTHGIETRAERSDQGKGDIGEITLALRQEGNEIIIAMSDDGRGLDAGRIRAKAESLGFLTPGEEADDARVFDFIFQPGFSTAGEVTQIAGRGVGMDVVKTEVASLGGRIEIATTPGQGTTFRLYLPLTLAVTQTLLVRTGSSLYAVPSTMIEQVLEMKEKDLAALRDKGEAEWHGNRYPFHFLPHLLGESGALPESHRRYWVILTRSGAQRAAVQVDELKGNQEVVVKHIGAQLARVVGIDGATVLGDGQVVLILNPVALANRALSLSLPAGTPVSAAPVAAAPTTLPTVLVVDDSLTVRKITGRLLAREGYQVVTAKDGVDALEQLQEIVPDVILSDIEMPRMDGFELVRNIRADAQWKTVPIIMITSRTADKHRNYAQEIGADHYLGKPYDEEELLGLIARYTRAPR